MSRRCINTTKAVALCAKIYRDTDWNEYAVYVLRNDNGRELASYYTDCREDAFDTAKAMLESEEQLWWASQGFDADNSTHVLHLFEDGNDNDVVPDDVLYLFLNDVHEDKQLSKAVEIAHSAIKNNADAVKVEVCKDMGNGHIAVLAVVF